MALLDEKNLAGEAAKRARFRVQHVGTKLNQAELHELEALAAKRKQTQGELIPRAGAAGDRTGQDGASAQCGDGGDHGVSATVGEPAGSAGEGRGDDARGVRRDRRRGQEAEGACGAGPAQRPRSAALSIGGQVPSAGAADGRTERKRSQKKSAATGTSDLPFFRGRVYGARETSQGSALRSDERAKDARP